MLQQLRYSGMLAPGFLSKCISSLGSKIISYNDPNILMMFLTLYTSSERVQEVSKDNIIEEKLDYALAKISSKLTIEDFSFIASSCSYSANNLNEHSLLFTSLLTEMRPRVEEWLESNSFSIKSLPSIIS